MSLYEDSQEADDATVEVSEEELEDDDDPKVVDEPPWDEMSPIRWMFDYSGRGALVEHALREVRAGDPIYRNKANLGEVAGTSRHSVHRHIDDLVELGIYEERENGRTRYRPNRHSKILAALQKANEDASQRSVEFE